MLGYLTKKLLLLTKDYTMQNKFMSVALLVTCIAFLPGCKIADWIKERFGCTNCVTSMGSSDVAGGSLTGPTDKNISQEVIVTIGGKPSVTADDFHKSLQLLMQTQQALQQVLPFMAEDQQLQLFQQIAENLAAERVAAEWVHRQGLDKTPEYQETARMVHDAVDRDLAARTFQAELVKKIDITDAQAKKYYEENKDKNPYFKRPPFTSGSASAKASGIVFDSEKDAQDFLAKAKKDFDAAAKENRKTIKDFGQVTAQSDIDNALKAKILNGKAPSVELIKGLDGKYYVVKIISKQEPQVAPFAEVNDKVKELMLSEKFQELFTKEIEKLKKEYGVTINQDYVKKFVANLRAQTETATQQSEAGVEAQAAPAAAAKPRAA